MLPATHRDYRVRFPLAWPDLRPADYDGLLLPGGHAPGMRQYLSSAVLQDVVRRFWALHRPVGAVCHGVLVLARTRAPATGRSLIADRRTTCLPKYLERGGYYLTAWRLGRYYRTYPAFVVTDGNYVSARWPGDAYLFAERFRRLLEAT